MRYIIKRYIILMILVFTMCIDNTKADLKDYSGGGSGSAGNMSSNGSWTATYSGIKIGIVNENGELEDVEIILDSGLPTYMNFSYNNNPKMFQSSSITWESQSTSNYVSTNLVPDSWSDSSNQFVNLDTWLSENNYSRLTSILALKKGNTNLFPTLSSGDFITVEPMTYIGGYFGTAYELGNAFLTLTDSCYSSGNFCWNYAGLVFGGINSTKTTSRRCGGIFHKIIYLDEAVPTLGLTVFEDSDGCSATSSSIFRERNNCLKSSTCGRGIGVYEYNDIYGEEEPPIEPPQPLPKYYFDINVVVDGVVIKNFLSEYGTYHLKINNSTHTNGIIKDVWAEYDSGTQYSISNIIGTQSYEYLGYNITKSLPENNLMDRSLITSTSNTLEGTITDTTLINLFFRSECQKQLDNIVLYDGTYNASDLFELYKNQLAKNKNYRNLLNLSNPSCSIKNCNDNSLSLSCLSGSTNTSEFNENDLSCYNEQPLTDIHGNYIGFCQTSYSLINNLGINKFYGKSGRLLISQEENTITIFEKNSLNKIVEKKLEKEFIATSTTNKVCYTLNQIDTNNINILPEYNVYFGDNNNDSLADSLTNTVIQNSVNHSQATNNLNMYTVSKTINYKPNLLYLEKISGKYSDTKSSSTMSEPICGLISRFDIKSGTIPFKVNDVSSNSCTYETTKEIIDEKMELEFRIIDTKTPFNRNTMTNWSDGDDNSKDNDKVNTYIKEAVNSYGLDKDGNKMTPKYKITLTPNDIKEIRKYNKTIPYDNYLTIEVEYNNKKIQRNSFLYSLEIGKLNNKNLNNKLYNLKYPN